MRTCPVETLQLITCVTLNKLLNLCGLCTFHLQRGGGSNSSTHITALMWGLSEIMREEHSAQGPCLVTSSFKKGC